MNAYLNTLTVKTLREIAKRIGFRFISRSRKAELISLILAEIDACHIEAIREDGIRTRQNEVQPYTGTRTIAAIKAEGIISRMDYPVPYGRVVTEAHVKICKEYGCASYVINGIDEGICPRCGEVTTSEEQVTAEEFLTVAVVDTVEFPMDHAQFTAWYKRFADFEASDAIEADHEEAFAIERIREVMTNGTAFQPAFMKYDAISAAHAEALTMNNDSEEKGKAAIAGMRMSQSDPIDDVIRFAREAIAALMPNLAATKLAFETLRDDESANPNHVDLAYQVYSDTHRAIEEYKSTIAYAESA